MDMNFPAGENRQLKVTWHPARRDCLQQKPAQVWLKFTGAAPHHSEDDSADCDFKAGAGKRMGVGGV